MPSSKRPQSVRGKYQATSNKRVRSSSGQSQNCVRLGTSRDKKCSFKSLRVKFFDDHRVSRKKIAGEMIFT